MKSSIWLLWLPIALLASAPAGGAQIDEKKLIALDGWIGYEFGNDVDIRGDVAAVGQWREDFGVAGSGSVYIWRLSAGQWELQQKLAAPATPYRFGQSVLTGPDFVAATSRNTAYVYREVGGSWILSQTLALVGSQNLELVTTVRTDGERLACCVGIDFFSHSSCTYLYQWDGSSFQLEDSLRPAELDSHYGDATVAIDQDWLAIGYPDSTPTPSGAVYMFEYADGSWTEGQKLTPSDGADQDSFGATLALQGNSMLVGAPRQDENGADAGAVYVFEFNGTDWVQADKLLAADAYPGDRFGSDVDLQQSTAVIGSPRDDDMGSGSGATYVFERVGSTWAQTTKITAADGEAFDALGSSVAVETNRIITGAPLDDFASGSAYIFTLPTLGPGIPFCYGDSSGGSCPCGNQSPTLGEGCLHSGARGMLIDGSGSSSVTADDLLIEASNCPPENTGIFFAGKTSLEPGFPLFDGLQCIGGDVRRFRPLFQDTGSVSDTGFVTQDPSGVYFNAGESVYFQYWTRDSAAGSSPCGAGANFSPAYAVLMTP